MFRLANIDDAPQIIQHIKESWRPDHPYVLCPELFLYDFVQGSDLNMGVLEIDRKITGIFGYFRYNSLDVPDIGGMMWSVTAEAQKIIPLAGIRLRNFVLNAVPHRFFGSPGSAKNTKTIYDKLGMIWTSMNHFVGSAEKSFWPEFIKLEGGILRDQNEKGSVKEIHNFDTKNIVDSSIFLLQTPRKDIEYLKWRFVENPFRSYKIWSVTVNQIQVLIITRKICLGRYSILRVVDAIGDRNVVPKAIRAVYLGYMSQVNYVDFVASGFNSDLFLREGFVNVDFGDNEMIVPNLFEPLVEKSVQIFANYDPGFSNVTMVRGNGDQDRPNIILTS